MNLGDRSEVRIYYLPHLVAHHCGLFALEGLEVSFVQSQSGGHTVKGGQVPAVISGEADLTIGGAMVTMKHAEEGLQLVNFCAAVRTNPWYVLGRSPEPDFQLSRLHDEDVLDIASVGTASFIFDEIMAREKIAARRHVQPDIETVEDWLGSEAKYATHHLHAAAPAIASGQVVALSPLAQATGGVPWSTYIARPDVMASHPEAFTAFRNAIAAALRKMETLPSGELAAMVSDDFPDLSQDERRVAIELGRTAGLWPDSPEIPRADFERFGTKLIEVGWLTRMPDWQALTIEKD